MAGIVKKVKNVSIRCTALERVQSDNIMKVCVCDDQELYCDWAREVCENYFKEKEIEAEIVICNSAVEVLDIVTELDILILDIEMPEMDGIELKNLLEKRMLDLYIIFMTNYDAKMQSAFGKNVIGFVSKEDMKRSLPYYMGRVVKLLERDVLIAGMYHSKNITWIHAEKEYIKLHEKNGTEYVLRESLTNLEEQLKIIGFVRPHRAWLVNFAYVNKIERTKMWVDKIEVPVSVRNRKKINDAYLEYLRTMP